jgi:hypothetical protein
MEKSGKLHASYRYTFGKKSLESTVSLSNKQHLDPHHCPDTLRDLHIGDLLLPPHIHIAVNLEIRS